MSTNKYTEESLIYTAGRWQRIADVSTRDLLKRYKLQKKKVIDLDQSFITYIDLNLQKFYEEAVSLGNTPVVQSIESGAFGPVKKNMNIEKSEDVCIKICYISKRVANQVLKEISLHKQENKEKPVRSYKCDKCSFWHHTSIALEYWKKVNK